MLNDPSTNDASDKFAGPNGVCYRVVPLYMFILQNNIKTRSPYFDGYNQWIGWIG